MKIHLYSESGSQPRERAVASLALGTRRDLAVQLPGQVGPSARFFLERVETPDPDLKCRLIDTLTRESLPILRAAASTRGGIRTRGDYRAQEPYGTAAYWRAAIGRIPHDLGLHYDLGDYRALLAWIDQPIEAVEVVVAQPKPERVPEPPDERNTSLHEALVALIGWLGRPRLALRGRRVDQPPRQLVEPLLQELETDREFLLATANLRLALSLPEEDREKILAGLDSLANRAKSHESQPD